MKHSFWICMFILAGSCVLVALPDSGERLFSINKDHGPSLTDTIGIIILLVTWTWMQAQVFRNRKKVNEHLGGKLVFLPIILVFVGMAGIIISLAASKNELLWPGIIAAVAGNFILMIPAFKKLPVK